MPRIDPALEAISARLTAAELKSGDASDWDDVFDEQSGPFVDAYSEAGLRLVFELFGVQKALEEQGLGDNELRISRDDPFTHRLQLLLRDGTQIMDLRLCLKSASLAPNAPKKPVEVVVVEWLLMQHPHRAFSPTHPRMPGQTHPGTGLGRLVLTLLLLLCKRLNRDGLVTVPERLHLALLYARMGFISIDHDGADLAAVAVADTSLSLAELAWAAERGCIVDEHGAPWRYQPRTMVCPVSPRLTRLLRAPPSAPTTSLHVDVDKLRASLATDPIEGLHA